KEMEQNMFEKIEKLKLVGMDIVPMGCIWRRALCTLALGASCLLPLGALAQRPNLSNSTKPISLDEPPVDGYFVKSDIQDRKVIEFAPIRAADVAFVKRVWQEFDLRDKLNAIYASPKSNLMQIIMEAVMAGE